MPDSLCYYTIIQGQKSSPFYIKYRKRKKRLLFSNVSSHQRRFGSVIILLAEYRNLNFIAVAIKYHYMVIIPVVNRLVPIQLSFT